MVLTSRFKTTLYVDITMIAMLMLVPCSYSNCYILHAPVVKKNTYLSNHHCYDIRSIKTIIMQLNGTLLFHHATHSFSIVISLPWYSRNRPLWYIVAKHMLSPSHDDLCVANIIVARGNHTHSHQSLRTLPGIHIARSGKTHVLMKWIIIARDCR